MCLLLSALRVNSAYPNGADFQYYNVTNDTKKKSGCFFVCLGLYFFSKACVHGGVFGWAFLFVFFFFLNVWRKNILSCCCQPNCPISLFMVQLLCAYISGSTGNRGQIIVL